MVLRLTPRWPTRTSVCTASGLLTTTTRRVGSGGAMNCGCGDVPALPVAEHLLHAVERLLGGDVADDGENGVVGHEIPPMVRHQVVARDRRQRLRRSALRQAVRMESVDQPIEHRVGDELRDPRSSPAAPTTSAGASARSPPARTPDGAPCRTACRRPVSKLSFMTTTLTKVRSVPAPGAHLAADEVDRVVHLTAPSAWSCPDRAARPRDRRARPCRADRSPRRRGRSCAC